MPPCVLTVRDAEESAALGGRHLLCIFAVRNKGGMNVRNAVIAVHDAAPEWES